MYDHDQLLAVEKALTVLLNRATQLGSRGSPYRLALSDARNEVRKALKLQPPF